MRPPTEQWCRPIPKRLDGSGVVWLFCTRGTGRYFRFGDIEVPRDWIQYTSPAGRHFGSSHGSGQCGGNGRFRIAYENRGKGLKPHTARFNLSSQWVTETLHVIAKHLNDNDIPYLYFSDGNGAQIRMASLAPKTLAA